MVFKLDVGCVEGKLKLSESVTSAYFKFKVGI